MKQGLRFIKSLGFILAILSLLGLCAVAAFGQEETGQIAGTVVDATGSLVQNATISITNLANGQTRTATSSGIGEYTITNLQPGTYTFVAKAPGFSEFKQTVEITVGSRTTLDAHLVVGGTGTVVEVSAQAAAVQVDTETQTLGQTITPTQLMQLPSLTRNPYDFVATAGNVSEGDNGNRGVGYSINGQRAASTNILLDGAENVDLFTADVGQNVPLDSVQEYKISTSNFTAESGRASGGIVNVVTKSGSNQFHGSLYEYNRVSALASETYQTDAANFAQKLQGRSALPNSSFVRNQFGYSVGGPIIKNKLFFFSNTEWTRIRSSENVLTYVLSPDFIAQSGAATQSFFNAYGALAKGVTNVGGPIVASDVAAGNVTGWETAGAGSPNFMALAAANPTLPVLQQVNLAVPTDAGAGSPQNSYSMVNRVDFNLSPNTTLWGRYALSNEVFFAGNVAYSPYDGYNTGENIRNQNVLINLTHVFTPNLVNQAKVSYNRLNDLQPLGGKPAVPSLYLSGSVPTVTGKSIALPGYLPYSQSNAIPFGGPQNLYEFTDQLSWTRGKHAFAFGGTYIQARDNRIFGAYEEGIADLGRSSTQSLDALLGGTIYSYQVAINPAGTYPCQTDITTDMLINPASCTMNLPTGAPKFSRNNRFNDGSFYGQDTWKLNRRLTLNLGLRWEYFGVQHNADPQLDSNFYYTGGLSPADVRAGGVTLAPDSTIKGLWNPAKRNFAPRIGFAYDIFGDGKTSLRGGYGISYERNFGNVTFNVIQNPPNYAVVSLAGSYPIPTDNLGPFAGTGTATLPAVTLRGVDPKIKTAYANMYSLSIERELVRNTIFAVEYSGSRGIHQYSITNVNRFFSGPTYNGDPNVNPTYVSTSAGGGGYEAGRTNNQYGNINFRGSNADSWYNGVNFRLQSTNFQSKGLTFAFNYTWSHALDDLSSTFTETLSGGTQGSLGFLDWQHPLFDKASADYDVRHRVAFSAVYSPTHHFANKFENGALGGWSIAPIWIWHTGTPFTLYDCGWAYGICARQLNGAGGTYSALAPSGDPISFINSFDYFTPAPYTPYCATVNGQLVNSAGPGKTCADQGTSDVPTCTNGTCAFPSNMVGRNAFRTPKFYNINLGVYKDFNLTERFKLQLRGEAYNLFNHSNYYLNYGTTDTEYGAPVTANKGYNGTTFERRNLQLAVRLQF